MTCQPITTLYEGKCVRGHNTRVVFCATCGYAHVHPKPTEEEMAEYYKTAYYTQDKPEYSQDQERIGEYLDTVNQEKILALGMPGYRVADFGCGHETRWMKALKSVGYWPCGVDPCFGEPETIIDGFSIYPNWDKFPRIAFSVISLNFVLEHVVNPLEVLAECHRRLGDDGQLLVEVPWDWNPIQMQVWESGDQAWWVSTPDHVNYLSPGTLEVLLRRCGFIPEMMRSTYPIENLILNGQDYRTDPEAKKVAVRERAPRQAAHWALGHSALCQEGRTVWCVARKA